MITQDTQDTNQTANWVGMAKEIGHYCSCCVPFQITKIHPKPPAPLQPVLAVDVLKVPTSPQGIEYLLVVQEYLSKWPFVMPKADQKAD